MSNLPTIIIGGGPAGLSAGLGLLRSNRSVLILDQRMKWSGRVCGSFLNPESIDHLRWLHVWDDIKKQSPPHVDSTHLTYLSSKLSTVKISRNGNPGLALPRQILEEILRKKFEREGGSYLEGKRIHDAKKMNDGWRIFTTQGDEFGTNQLIFADGRFSRGHSLINKVGQKSGWYGWNASFKGAPLRPGEMSLNIIPGGYVGVLTFNDGTTNVCGLTFLENTSESSWENCFKIAQDSNFYFNKIISPAHQLSPWQGVGPLPFGQKAPFDSSCFLVGDAAAVGDPFMGEGIARALSAGPMLYEALKNAQPEIRYNQLWAHSYSGRLNLSRWVRWSLVRPWALSLSSRWIFRHPSFINFATHRFHVGYNPRQNKQIGVS